MHEGWHNAALERRDTSIVSKEHARVSRKRRQIDFVIYKRTASVDTARKCQACLSTRSFAPVVKNNVYRTVGGIDTHPCEKLHLAVLDRVIVHAHRAGPAFSTIFRRHYKHIRIS